MQQSAAQMHPAVPQRDEQECLPRPKAVMGPATSIEIVFKIQETCNLNCSYCYMYNMGNELFRAVPVSAPLEVCRGVAEMIAGQFRRGQPRFANLVLHGGEPMLMPIHRFRERMELIHNHLASSLSAAELARVSYTIQTNATLVTTEWIRLLSQYNVNVGVTIDGPREFHDSVRRDRRGRGSYDRVVAGLEQLVKASDEGLLKRVACLMVINPEVGGARAYEHLASELGFRNIDFLLPFRDWDSYDPEHARAVGTFLVDAFRAWAGTDDQVSVRIFNHAIRSMMRPQAPSAGGAESTEVNHHYIVVESDGSIMPDETVRTRGKSRFTDANVFNSSFEDAFYHPFYRELTEAHLAFPPECTGCALATSCCGGRSLGRVGARFSTARGFWNRSAHCESFIPLYAEVFRFLSQSGSSRVRDLAHMTLDRCSDTFEG